MENPWAVLVLIGKRHTQQILHLCIRFDDVSFCMRMFYFMIQKIIELIKILAENYYGEY